MTWEQAKAYMEEISRTGSILGLESIENLMKELGDVQEKLQIIHLAGTNGKGSTGAFIESVLIEAGYKVGRYTSPAVFEPFEVWRINRKNISMEAYLNCLGEVKTACERILEKGMAQPTVFEVETALAFLYFYENQCDYVLLEVGMGGETDATNLIKQPLCSVITSISMDHMQFLGNSLAEIASVKAGIIKKCCPVVTGNAQKTEVLDVIKSTAEKKGAELILAEEGFVQEVQMDKKGTTYRHSQVGEVAFPLMGEYQIENSNLAITVCKEVLGLSAEVIKKGFRKAVWPGRFELISEKPIIILDGAHNEDAAEKLAKTLQKHFTNAKITYIIGVLADKEHAKVLKHMLPLAESVYTVTPDNKRALDGQALAEEVQSMGKAAVYCADMADAAAFALEDTKSRKTDMIVVFGSLSYLSAIKQELYSILKR